MKIFIKYMSKKSLSLENGSRMVRDRFEIGSAKSRKSIGSNLSRLCLASLICLCMLTVGSGNAWGDSQSFNKSDFTSSASSTKTPITVTFSSTPTINNQQIRFSSGSTVTFTSSSGNITGIAVATNSSNQYIKDMGATVTSGTWSGSETSYSWSGNTSSITMTAGAACRITTITVTYSASSCSNKVTITKGTPEAGGSFSLDKTGEQDCCNALTVTVSAITAPSGKQFSAITQSGINSGVSINQEAKTVTYAANSSGSSTINVTYEDLPKYRVTYNAGTGTCLTDHWDQPSYGASTDLPSATPPATCSGGWSFAGWCTSSAGSADENSTRPGTILTGSYTPTGNVTLYAVYQRTASSGTTTYTLVDDAAGFTDGTYVVAGYASSTYYFMNGEVVAGTGLGVEETGLAAASVSDGSFAASSLPSGAIEIDVEDDGEPDGDNHYYFISYTSGGDTYYMDDSGTKQSLTWTTNTTVYTYHPNFTQNAGTDGCVLLSSSGAKVSQNGSTKASFIRNYASSGSFYNDMYFFKKSSGTTYYMTSLVCCTDPGLNYGTESVTKTFGADAFTNTLTNSHSVAVTYSSSDETVATVNGSGQVTILKAGSTTITASSVAQTVSTVGYCADEASYTLTVNKASISPTLSYTPNSVAVGENTSAPTVGGNPGGGGVTYAITSATPAGCATIDAGTGVVSGVAVGSVTVTATVASTTNYNGGSATANVTITAASGYCISAFNSSNNGITSGFSNGGLGNEYTLSYTIPGKDGSSNWPQYWIGENEAWASFSANALFADMHFTHSDATLGLAEGATGKLHIWDDNKANGSNLWVKFEPDGYGFRWGGTGEWDQAANTKAFTVDPGNANTYWTEIVTLDGTNNTTWNYYVGLQSASGYVHSGVDNEGSDNRGVSRTRSVTTMKVSNGTAGSYKATNLNSEAAGTRGKFRIWDNNISDYNFVCHFVPYYRVTYNGNGTSGSTAASADVCCEGNAAARTVVAAANGFTVPTGKTFGGWASSPENAAAGVVAYAAGANVVLTSSITLYAIWTDINYTVTVNQNPSVGATTTGQTTTAHYGGTINISTTVPDGYRFDGWTASPSVTFASSSSTSTSFTMPASDVTITASFTRIDTYIDNIWNTATQTKTGTYTRPTLSDQTPGGLTDCQHLHYHFVGWITKAKYDAGTTIDARTTPTGDLVAGGSVTANGSTYYAVWEKENGVVSNDYELVTSSSAALADGDQIIIATSGEAGEAKAMGYSRGNNRAAVDVTIASGAKIENPTLATLSSDQDYIYPLQLVANSTFFNIKDKVNDKYLAATGNTSNNYLNLLTDGNDNRAKFTISVAADGVATITANITGTNIRNKMKYNSGNNPPIISCYNSGQSAVYIYRKPGVSYEDPVASCGAEYTITIDKNNASAACSSCGAKVNANAVTLSNLVAPTWTGHQVDYYMIASADNSTKIAEADGSLAASVTDWTDGDGKWIKGSDATIYAKWKYAEYEIAYYDQGGSAFSGVHGADHPTIHTYNTATALVTPTKNGYNFAGWYTSSDCSTGLVTSLGATAYTSGPINLYAKWTLKTYDVTWVVNGTTIETESSVAYGTYYEELSSIPDNPADNALADCGSDKFIGWVTAEYTAEGGTKVSQYDPYAVTNSTMIDDTHHTFYAMFAKESGTAFSLSVTSGDFKISGLVGGVNYYATGELSSGQYGVTTTASDGDLFTFTKVSDGVYTILHKKSSKYVKWNSSTNFKEETTAENWTITAASHGSWCVVPAGATTRAFVMYYSSSNPASNSVFKPYAQTNVTNTPAQYYYVEIGTSNLTNYRTGCCSETITLTVSDATSGAGGTVAMKWNNASKSSGDAVSTCSTGTLVVDVTANPSYTLTAITIAGTNKTITLDPADLTTGLPSTSKMTYTVSVPSLATGTLTITPTFTRTYSVTYNLDGGETAGSTAVANYQSGATVTLVTPNPTKSGYDFTGWTVTKDGGGNVSVSAGQFSMPADNVTITAGWTAKTLTSISVSPTTAEVYIGQYVLLPVSYDPADILTKGYTLVSSPAYCVTTGSTNTTLKITGGRSGATINENKTETLSIKANADNTKTASVTVTVKPLPVDHFVDLVHGETFADQAATIVDNNLSTAYTAPGHADVDAPLEGNDCEKQHLHLVGWIESEWANAHLTATMSEITSAEDNEHNPLFFEVYAPMNVSGKTYYAVWGKEVTP